MPSFLFVIADRLIWFCLSRGHVPAGAVHGQWCTCGSPGLLCLTTMFRVERGYFLIEEGGM